MKRFLPLLPGIALLLLPSLQAQDKPAAEGAAAAIEANDRPALVAAVGKAVVVHGTVESIEREGEDKAVRILFTGGHFRAMVDPADYRGKKWAFDDPANRELFVKGEISADGDLLQVWLGRPNQVATSREVIDGKAPAAKPEPPKKYEPVGSGAVLPVGAGSETIETRYKSASVLAVVPKFGDGAGTKMVISKVEVEIHEHEDSGPMQASFELKPKATIAPMVAVMTYLPKKYAEQGWPRNSSAHFVLDEIQSDSAPPNFAAAVLIEALMQGIRIPENVVLFGGMKADGSLSRSGDKPRADASYVEAINLTAQAAMPEPDPEAKPERLLRRKPVGAEKSMVLVTGQMPDGVLDDFVLDEDWATLNSVIVIRCSTIDEAVTVVKDMGEVGEVAESIAGLIDAQKVLRERSIRMLANEQVWARVIAAGRALKTRNATAFAYARMRAKKTAETYSLDRCIAHIDGQVELGNQRLEKLEERELRKYMRDLATEMERIERLIHPDATELYTAAEAYLDAAYDFTKEKKRGEPSERVVEKRNTAKAAYSEAHKTAQAKLAEAE